MLDTDARVAAEIAERVRLTVIKGFAEKWAGIGACSIGGATRLADGETFEMTLALADAALYQAKKMGGFPDAAFVVFVKPGFNLGGSFTGDIVRDTKVGGTHGLLRDLPEMDSSFFIVGAGVPKGKVFDRIDMRDIAPTLAGFIGVKLPKAEGKDLFRETQK